MAKQTVELALGESKQVSFEAIPNTAKVYQVSVDGLSGSFEAFPAPAFNFGTPWENHYVCPEATAWWTYEFGCSIANPHGQTVKHTLKFIEHVYSLYHQEWYDPTIRHTFELTLQPGQTYNYTYPKSSACDPLVARPRQYYLYLEDELGNQSEKAFFERGYGA